MAKINLVLPVPLWCLQLLWNSQGEPKSRSHLPMKDSIVLVAVVMGF